MRIDWSLVAGNWPFPGPALVPSLYLQGAYGTMLIPPGMVPFAGWNPYQAEEASCESRHTKQDRYAEMRRRKDEEREALERQQEEEAMARKAKEEEAAALEFEKWKGDFSVDAEGTTENEVQDGSRGLAF